MVSIIMPTYNREKTIKRAIDSILEQTYQDFEIIIVDDNSKDNTEQIVKSIEDRRIIYIRNEENKGANASRNIGIEMARGEYIAFQDSDDEWLKEKLEYQLEELKVNRADIVASAFYKYVDKQESIVPSKIKEDKNIYEDLFFGNFISTQTILGKKKCFLEEGFDPTFPRFQDWELMIRMAKRYKIHFINKPLANVYVQEDSISRDTLKAEKALVMMFTKYKEEIDARKKAKASLYKRLGDCYHDRKDYSVNYYLEAFKLDKLNIEYALRAIKFALKK